MHGLTRLAITVLFTQLLIAPATYAGLLDVYSGTCQGVSQRNSKCGPECTCGCNEGKECTCHPTESAVGYNDSYSQGNSYNYNDSYNYDGAYSYNDSYNYDGAYNYEDDTYGMEDDQCCCGPQYKDPSLQIVEPCCAGGIWLPEDPVLFRPFMADPREVCYSVGWRFDDNVFNRNVIDVSFGDTLAIYRWCNVWPWNGQLQIELEGALWAIFEPLLDSSPLVNADYYVGVPITYAIDGWQFRLRGYHISSHIGDEFLLTHRNFDRRNASAEYLDFFISHDLTEEIRLYAGLGYIISQDEEFHCKPFYSACGAELRLLSWGFQDEKDVLYGCPIYAMHFRQNGEFKKHIDATYILGYEIGKLCGLQRRWRVFMEYHDGYSVEGQFCKIPTNYFSIRTSYGF